MASSTAEQHAKQQTLELDLLLDAVRNLDAKCVEYNDWLSQPWDEATAKLMQKRTILTSPARLARRASAPAQDQEPVQPKAN
jgi:hypothetical protein